MKLACFKSQVKVAKLYISCHMYFVFSLQNQNSLKNRGGLYPASSNLAKGRKGLESNCTEEQSIRMHDNGPAVKGEVACFVNQPPIDGPLFENKNCYCGKKAAVLISECNFTCGKLYYACFNGNCKYYEWWRPHPEMKTGNEENGMKNASEHCLKSLKKQMLVSSSLFSFLTVVTIFVAMSFKYQG